jgi:hypothetical protein
MELPQLPEVQYQSYAQGQAFDPVKLPDPNPQLSQNLNTIQSNFAQMSKFGSQNLRNQYAEKLSTVQQLAQFSKTALDITEIAAKENKKFQEAQAEQQFFELLSQGKLSPEDYTAPLSAIDEKGNVIETEVAGAVRSGKTSFEVGDWIRRNLSGHRFTKFSELYSEYMTRVYYEPWIRTQRLQNTDTIVIKDEEGNDKEVVINDQKLPPFQARQVRSRLQQAFFQLDGYQAVSPAVKMKSGSYENIIKADIAIEKAETDRWKDWRSEELRAEALQDLRVNFTDPAAFTRALNTFASTTIDGKVIGMTGAWKLIEEEFESAAQLGKGYDLEAFAQAPSHIPGKTIGQAYPRFNSLRVKVSKALQIKREENEKNRTLEVKTKVSSWITEAISRVGDDAFSIAEFEEAERGFRKEADRLGISYESIGLDRLSELKNIYSYTGRRLEDARRQLQAKVDTRTLTTGDPLLQHPILREEFFSKAEEIEKTTLGPEFKERVKSLTGYIAGLAGVETDVRGELKGDLNDMNIELRREMERTFLTLTLGPQKLPPEEAAEQAYLLVRDKFKEGFNNKTSLYYPGTKGDFPNWQKYLDSKLKNVESYKKRANALVRLGSSASDIIGSVTENPAVIGSLQDVERMYNVWNQTASLDPWIRQAAKEINSRNGRIVINSPIQLLMAAAKGHGIIQEIPAYAEIIERSTQIRPEARKILNDLLNGNLERMQGRILSSDTMPRISISGDDGTPPTSNDPMIVAIGINEGTRTAGGGKTSAYAGHTDPGDRARNRGTFSYAPSRFGTDPNMSPEEADRAYMPKLVEARRKYSRKLVEFGYPVGSREYNILMFNILDLTVQAPAAVEDFVNSIPNSIKGGELTAESIGSARAYAFFNPNTGRLEASGFNNDFERLRQDQIDRAMTLETQRRGR